MTGRFEKGVTNKPFLYDNTFARVSRGHSDPKSKKRTCPFKWPSTAKMIFMTPINIAGTTLGLMLTKAIFPAKIFPLKFETLNIQGRFKRLLVPFQGEKVSMKPLIALNEPCPRN